MAGTASPDDRPDVTIVVATRDRAGWLDACLASLTAQESARPFEVVVVDNGSSDRTPDVVAAWAARDGRVRGVVEPVAGLSRAKNAGVAAARASVLLFTDDDVVAPPGWVDALGGFLAGADGDGVLAGGPIVPVPDDLDAWPAWFSDGALRHAGMLDYDGDRPLHEREYVWGANMGARRSLLERIGPWDETVGRRADERGTFEDTEYQDRARSAGAAVWFRRDAWLQHRVPRSTLSPRRLLHVAVLHGVFDVDLARHMTADPGVAAGPSAASGMSGAAAVAVRAAAAACWVAAFRAVAHPALFERARDAMWRLGTTIAVARPGAARAGHRLARAIERVSPDGPTAAASGRHATAPGARR